MDRLCEIPYISDSKSSHSVYILYCSTTIGARLKSIDRFRTYYSTIWKDTWFDTIHWSILQQEYLDAHRGRSAAVVVVDNFTYSVTLDSLHFSDWKKKELELVRSFCNFSSDWLLSIPFHPLLPIPISVNASVDNWPRILFTNSDHTTYIRATLKKISSSAIFRLVNAGWAE